MRTPSRAPARTKAAKKAKPATARKDSQAENQKLRATVRALTREKARLEEQLAKIEAECKRYFDQFVDVEVASTNVANLYVASLRLHATLSREDVLSAIQEIVINLVGSEELCVFEVDASRRALRLVSSFGVDARAWQDVPFGVGIVGAAAASCTPWIASLQGEAVSRGPNEAHLTAAIPLVVEGRIAGLVAIFRLLDHKRGLEDVDHELFNLLGTQAGAALYFSSLARTGEIPSLALQNSPRTS
jgi:hypothetical protein